MADAPSSGYGRGRARARIHRSISPRGHPGSVVPPGPRGPSPTREMEKLSILGTSSSGSGERGRSTGTRGATRGIRITRSDKDYLVTSIVPDQFARYGTSGEVVKTITNFFRLKSAPKWNLYQYDVKIKPDCERIGTRKAILRKSLNQSYIYNGIVLLLTKQLEVNPYIFTTECDGQAYEVKIKHTKDVQPRDPEYLHFHSLILRYCLHAMGLQLLGRNFYDPEKETRIDSHKLILWPGFITSLRRHEGDVLLCVETSHKVLRMDSVLVKIREIQSRPGVDRRRAEDEIRKALQGSIVLTTYNRKTYKILEVIFEETPKTTFEYRGQEISIVDYYKTKKDMAGVNVEIKDLTQPLLIAEVRKQEIHRTPQIKGGPAFMKVKLIPELCQLTGLSDDMRENFSLMRELAKYLHVSPQEKIKEIKHFMEKLKSPATKLDEQIVDHLMKWGLKFDDQPLPVEGRVMKKDSIIFADGQEQPIDNKADWTMAFRNKKMLTAVNLQKWVLIAPRNNVEDAQKLVGLMKKVSAPLGMNIAQPLEVFPIQDMRGGQGYVNAIKTLKNKHSELQMFFVILPSNKPEPYGVVKRLLAVQDGILSQCFVARNLQNKGLMSIATKVVVQMNAKLGGEPWTIKLPLKNTMFVGYDVNKKGSKGGTIGAMVATISNHFTRYFSTTSIYANAEEISTKADSDFTKCLNAYKDHNATLPDRIIVFRDGVSEGQLEFVQETEIKTMKNALEREYRQKGFDLPKLTFIVVTKRVNTRIILDKGQTFDSPAPGTIVDKLITNPFRINFYLISCTARQGTVSPCCYNVIYTDDSLDANKLQMMTYKMCHMYFNWSGTVAVPAPCQYAHKLAFITGMAYMDGTGEGRQGAHPNLSNLLHFL